jgi:hypothetical protein
MRKGDRVFTEKEFKEVYFEYFDEGLLDWEIAHKLFISAGYLSELKDLYAVRTHRRRKNVYGITEKHFRIGMENGLSRRLINQRVRVCGYSVQQAITEPKKKCDRSKKK